MVPATKVRVCQRVARDGVGDFLRSMLADLTADLQAVAPGNVALRRFAAICRKVRMRHVPVPRRNRDHPCSEG